MSDEKKYEAKHGDISVFVNAKREKENQPLMWGKVVLNLNDEEMKAAADANGMVELRVSLWGYQGKNGNYWAGKVSVPQQQRTQSDALPPASQEMGVNEGSGESGQPNDLPF